MTKYAITAIFFLLILSSHSFSTDIYGLYPYEIYPGTEVTISGKDFNNNTVVVFGNKAFKPHSVSSDKMKFYIPNNIEPGIYLLSIKTDTREILPFFTVVVKKREFLVKRFYPEVIDSCGEGNIVIAFEGDNLDMVKKISLQGTGTLPFSSSKTKINFELPYSVVNKKSYLNVYLYNDEERVKEVVTININNRPFIESVDIVSSEITNITLRIKGKNFTQPLRLFVNSEMIIERGTEGLTREVYKKAPFLDRFEFVNCREIIYKRYPTSSEAKELLILVENPGGERSNTFSISIP